MKPIFSVCEISKAASTSSRIQKGAGLYQRSARMKLNASKDLCPPLNSDKLSFHFPPNRTLISMPSLSSFPAIFDNLAVAPFRRSSKIFLKFSLTPRKHFSRDSFFFISSSEISFIISNLSFSTSFQFFNRSLYFCSMSQMFASTVKFTLFLSSS